MLQVNLKISKAFAILIFSGSVLSLGVRPAESATTNLSDFIVEMVQAHNFDEAQLSKMFDELKPNTRVLSAMARPSTAKPWHEFKGLFLTKSRTEKGVKFWRENNKWLEKAKSVYGVPPEIIVAIIGVETIYGRRLGNFKVLESLYTLGFKGKRRRAFFTKELKEFLILCRENNLDTMTVSGSFAGALGMPQFMPSSYRAYAVDFDEDGRIDLWNSIGDIIGSVANYLKLHGWIADGEVVVRAKLLTKEAFKLTKRGVKPHIIVSDLQKRGVQLKKEIPSSTDAAIFWLQGVGKRHYWVSFKNFYVITRYNRSLNYALVVYQLAQRIKGKYQG